MRDSNGMPLDKLISRFLKAYGLEGKMEEMNVVNNWENIMGKAVANRTKKIRIMDKTLILEIDSSVMRDELHSGKELLIAKVNDYVGKEMITDVWFS